MIQYPRIPLYFAFVPALAVIPLVLLEVRPRPAEAQSSKTYVVLMVTASDGKVSHKALAEKEVDSFKKLLEEEFQKARRRHQEEKKAFQKAEKGKKFEKPEPQKPRVQVAKRAIKTFNEASRAAFDQDQAREKKNGKGKNGKNGKAEKKPDGEGGDEKKGDHKKGGDEGKGAEAAR